MTIGHNPVMKLKERPLEIKKEGKPYQALSIVKRAGGYSVLVTTIENNRVIGLQYSVPEARSISLELLKKRFVELFILKDIE